VVERAVAGLGPSPGAELLTVRLLDAYANIEGGLGNEETRTQVRRRLEEIEAGIDPDGYEALYLHSAWAQIGPETAEEHELAVWQLASVHLGPLHDLTRNRDERYIRKACERWSAWECTQAYEELRDEVPGRSVQVGPAILVTTEAFALSQAGHTWAAWELRSAIRDAVERSDKPAEQLIGTLALAGLAMADPLGATAERTELAEAGVELIASLQATQYLGGARMLAASVAASVGDRAGANAHLHEIESLGDALLFRYARAEVALALGDATAALADLEPLPAELETTKNNLWVELPKVKQALCEASFRAGTDEQAQRHCTAAAEEPGLGDSERERAMARIALRELGG
jgi:hypothetical protein